MTSSASTVDPLSPHGASVGSPCVNICELDSDFVCIGCGRTIDEVLKWTQYTEEEKQQVLDRIFGDSKDE